MKRGLRIVRYAGLSVPWTGLEPACRFQHHPLKMACLPISPPGQRKNNKEKELTESVYQPACRQAGFTTRAKKE